jgi:hypothetical protein
MSKWKPVAVQVLLAMAFTPAVDAANPVSRRRTAALIKGRMLDSHKDPAVLPANQQASRR